jgi:hypothetical protein
MKGKVTNMHKRQQQREEQRKIEEQQRKSRLMRGWITTGISFLLVAFFYFAFMR